PPGAIVDTVRARLLTWIYLVKTWSPRGGDVRIACEQAFLRSGELAMDGGPPRNEFLHFAYRYGTASALITCLVIAGIVWSGDPTLASAGVVCFVTSPIQAFKRWLKRGDGPLFGPPLIQSLTVHADYDGVHVFGAAGQEREAIITLTLA